MSKHNMSLHFLRELLHFSKFKQFEKEKKQLHHQLFPRMLKKMKIENDKLFTMATGLALLQQSTRSFDLCIPGLDTYPLPLYLACSFT